MRGMAIRQSISAILLAVVLCTAAFAQKLPLPTGKAEDVGMSSSRLAEIGKTLKVDVEHGQIPGAVIVVARRGKIVYFEAIGYRDKAAGLPMTTDTLFNIASMTKPMTAVAGLQLFEQGRLLMDEPLSKYFPKFANMQVAVMDAKQENIIGKLPAARQITIQDLFRHTSGLIYGGRGTTAVHKLYPSGSSIADPSIWAGTGAARLISAGRLGA